MAYNRETFIEKIKLRTKPMYQDGCVNYVGFTTDTNEKYTEIIAEQLLADIEKYESSIHKIKRENSYKVKSHKWRPYDPDDTSIKRKEERLAQSMFGRKFGELEILDYQIPLKNARTEENKGLGKIDLLAWDGNCLIILELKKPDSTETLLRCVLEAYTYWKTVDHKKLAQDFGHTGAPVRAASLVFANSQQHKDWLCKKQPHIKKLMKQLGVKLYVMDNDTDLKIFNKDGGRDQPTCV